MVEKKNQRLSANTQDEELRGGGKEKSEVEWLGFAHNTLCTCQGGTGICTTWEFELQQGGRTGMREKQKL